jgi:DNA-binding CsgD family transcriptional regulator
MATVTLLEQAEVIAQIGSWRWWPETGDVQWSDNLFRLMGFEPGEVTPSVELVRDRAHPEDRELIDRAVDSLSREDEHPPVEYRSLLPDGELRRVRWVVTAVRPGPDGERMLVGVLQDVTDQRGQGRPLESEAGSLSARELEVLGLAAEGYTGREIAELLGLAPSTVQSHLHNTYEKLGVRGRTSAVATALRSSLIA